MMSRGSGSFNSCEATGSQARLPRRAPLAAAAAASLTESASDSDSDSELPVPVAPLRI